MVSFLGSLVQCCCGEGGALQTNVTGLCGGHSQCLATPVPPPPTPANSQRVHFPGLSRSDSGFRVLHKSADSTGPAFCAFPARAAQAARSLRGALSPGAARLLFSAVPASVSGRAGRIRLVSLLGSWPVAATLPANVDHPESREVFG